MTRTSNIGCFFATLALALALATLIGCAPVEGEAPDVGIEDPVDDGGSFTFADASADAFGLIEGSADGEALLRLVNDGSSEELTAPGGLRLSARVSAEILKHRAGQDGVHGTLDDDPLNTLTELDAVPRVGRVVFERLRTFVRANPVVDTACAATDARPFPLELVVAPGPVEARILELLGRATRSIDITIYQFTSRPIRAALEAAVGRGVHVRVILDRAQPENIALANTLISAGIEAHQSSRAFVFTHQKTITIDEELTLVFSGNLETRSFATSRNYGAIDRDFEDVRDFDTLFEADWIDAPVTLGCTRLVYSPVTSRSRVLDLLKSAQRNIDVEAMYVTDPAVIAELLAAQRRGVAVRVLFNDPRFGIGNSGQAARALTEAGATVRRLPALFIHAKVIMVDRAFVFLGSENFSTNSLDRNREAGLVLGSSYVDVERVLAVLESDWQQSVAF